MSSGADACRLRGFRTTDRQLYWTFQRLTTPHGPKYLTLAVLQLLRAGLAELALWKTRMASSPQVSPVSSQPKPLTIFTKTCLVRMSFTPPFTTVLYVLVLLPAGFGSPWFFSNLFKCIKLDKNSSQHHDPHSDVRCIKIHLPGFVL
jgi:hypothetical protein